MKLLTKSYKSGFDLTGKAAVVTGGLGILGKHFCAGLAESGASVAVIDLDENAACAYAEVLTQQYGTAAVGIGCDVTDPYSVKDMVARVVNSLGEIHILHNNAAWKAPDLRAYFASFEEYDPLIWRQVMSVNVDGMFLVAQAVGGQIVKQGLGGSIIQTASIYGAMAPDHRIYEGSHYLGGAINTPAVYSASKAAVIGLTQHLATYWADKGIRVNAIAPGGVESGQNAEFKNRYSSRIPLGRMAQANEIVGALLFLASDAASYITGQVYMVDGGLSAW